MHETVLVPVGRVDEFRPGDARVFQLEGREVALFNVDGTFLALESRCLFDGGDLGRGQVRREIVTCPARHCHYRLRTGELVGVPRRRLRSYPIELHQGSVWISMPRKRFWTSLLQRLRRLVYVTA
jgi:3-phenylpropionate/trans-cinnamate dioxygenase ferredoxin component